MTVPWPEEIPIPEEKREEVQRRLDAFTSRFPGSKILKMVALREDATADELLDLIQQAIGKNEPLQKQKEMITAQLERGQLPFPYAWRPGIVLGGATDLPTFWELGKQTGSDQRQYHLTMAMAGWQPVPYATMREHVPLLDMTSILVVHDLDLWEPLFRLFPRIAIGQETLMDLLRYLTPACGSPLRSKCQEIQKVLNANIGRIIQPSNLPGRKRTHRFKSVASEEVEALAREGRFMLYSDDVFFRTFIGLPPNGVPSICTLDVLNALDEGKNAMSPAEVATKIATLYKWNVDVTVLARYQVALLPDELESVGSAREGIEVLQNAHLCFALFSGLWNPCKRYDELQIHAASLLREFCSKAGNRPESVAALLGLWYGKAKLHKKAPRVPLECAAGLMIRAAALNPPLDAETSHRIWDVYRKLVELEHGDRMDEGKEREAIRLAGRLASDFDRRHSLQGNASMQGKLTMGLPDGTSDWDDFLGGYADYRVAQEEKELRGPAAR
jgi:hypothetical protein